jgi:PPK2 family polyphosphate:nucleotide phosphotransferase
VRARVASAAIATHDRWVVHPGHRLDLGSVDPSSTPGAPGGRAATEAELPALVEKLRDLQDRLWGEGRRSLLVVLQAMDAGGKDGTIKHVFDGVNPQGTRVEAFKVPTPEELAHDFLWRVHAVTPAAGEITIFNRSHYEDVLVPRVHHTVDEHEWRRRYGEIRDFEALLTAAGTTIVKLFLHISRDEQRARLEERLHRPDKRWKLQTADFTERRYWDDYRRAYEDAISETSTGHAPWRVVPANHKWYRNWAVSTVLVETLRAMAPQYPEPAELGDIDEPGVT